MLLDLSDRAIEIPVPISWPGRAPVRGSAPGGTPWGKVCTGGCAKAIAGPNTAGMPMTRLHDRMASVSLSDRLVSPDTLTHVPEARLLSGMSALRIDPGQNRLGRRNLIRGAFPARLIAGTRFSQGVLSAPSPVTEPGAPCPRQRHEAGWGVRSVDRQLSAGSLGGPPGFRRFRCGNCGKQTQLQRDRLCAVSERLHHCQRIRVL